MPRENPCSCQGPLPSREGSVGAGDSRFWQKPSMQRLRKATCASIHSNVTPKKTGSFCCLLKPESTSALTFYMALDK